MICSFEDTFCVLPVQGLTGWTHVSFLSVKGVIRSLIFEDTCVGYGHLKTDFCHSLGSSQSLASDKAPISPSLQTPSQCPFSLRGWKTKSSQLCVVKALKKCLPKWDLQVPSGPRDRGRSTRASGWEMGSTLPPAGSGHCRHPAAHPCLPPSCCRLSLSL